MASPKTLDPDLGIAANRSGGSLGRPQFEEVPPKTAEDEKGRRHP